MVPLNGVDNYHVPPLCAGQPDTFCAREPFRPRHGINNEHSFLARYHVALYRGGQGGRHWWPRAGWRGQALPL